ncbi:hypothetical protein, partial [Paraburkholderia fungorum]|uniref:hypothetical protein n=1 Tax=Paraburkholderia fungorum TaxID=134537 RepID=UPI001C1ECE65
DAASGGGVHSIRSGYGSVYLTAVHAGSPARFLLCACHKTPHESASNVGQQMGIPFTGYRIGFSRAEVIAGISLLNLHAMHEERVFLHGF